MDLLLGKGGAGATRQLPASAEMLLTGAGDPTVQFDLLGLLLLSGGLVAVTYGATQGLRHGWASTATWPTLLGSSVGAMTARPSSRA